MCHYFIFSPSFFLIKISPGGVQSKLARHIFSDTFQFVNDFVQLAYWTIEDAALTCIGAALKKDIPNGSYFVPVSVISITTIILTIFFLLIISK
jgi:hypothetical protein